MTSCWPEFESCGNGNIIFKTFEFRKRGIYNDNEISSSEDEFNFLLLNEINIYKESNDRESNNKVWR